MSRLVEVVVYSQCIKKALTEYTTMRTNPSEYVMGHMEGGADAFSWYSQDVAKTRSRMRG